MFLDWQWGCVLINPLQTEKNRKLRPLNSKAPPARAHMLRTRPSACSRAKPSSTKPAVRQRAGQLRNLLDTASHAAVRSFTLCCPSSDRTYLWLVPKVAWVQPRSWTLGSEVKPYFYALTCDMGFEESVTDTSGWALLMHLSPQWTGGTVRPVAPVFAGYGSQHRAGTSDRALWDAKINKRINQPNSGGGWHRPETPAGHLSKAICGLMTGAPGMVRTPQHRRQATGWLVRLRPLSWDLAPTPKN